MVQHPPKVIAQWVGGINYAEFDASTLAGIVAQTQLRAKHHQATLWLHHVELPYPVPASGLELGFHCWAENTRQAWSHSRQPRLCWHKALYTKVYLSTPATQNHVTTCFGTLKQDRFCSFPHRHGEATGKPETRDDTCWSIKTSVSCETSSNFHTL